VSSRWLTAIALLAALLGAGCREREHERERETSRASERVVAIAPNLAEIIADIGGAGRLAGLSSYGRVPPGADRAERVGGFIDPSIERIIALRPDLVVGVPLQQTSLDSCRAAGLRTLVVDCQTIEQAIEAYTTLGRALELEAPAAEARARLERALDEVRARAAHEASRPRALLMLGRAGDDLQQIFPVAPGNFADQLLVIAGGRNALESAAPLIGAESVISLAPEVIVEIAMDETADQADRLLEPSPIWPRLPSVPAVRDGRVFAVASATLLQPGPEMADGAALLQRLLFEVPPPRPAP
jgi:iron complex transport system substrate-binding protein